MVGQECLAVNISSCHEVLYAEDSVTANLQHPTKKMSQNRSLDNYNIAVCVRTCIGPQEFIMEPNPTKYLLKQNEPLLIHSRLGVKQSAVEVCKRD